MAKIDQDFLAALAATSPAAKELVDLYRTRRRGQPRKSDFKYRRLAVWWKCYRRSNSGLTDELAFPGFMRLRGKAIAKDLGLKRSEFNSLRNAIRRGERESERVRYRRTIQLAPRIVPSGLVQKILKGTDWQIVSDPNEAILVRAAFQHFYLGSGPSPGMTN
jgi:hypothetical protein